MPTATATAADPACDPAAAWKALAPLLAARPTVRTWTAATGKFDHSTPLSSRLPRQPAAVALYTATDTPRGIPRRCRGGAPVFTHGRRNVPAPDHGASTEPISPGLR